MKELSWIMKGDLVEEGERDLQIQLNSLSSETLLSTITATNAGVLQLGFSKLKANSNVILML